MSEHSDQVALMNWAVVNATRLPQLTLLLAIPNGTRTTPAIARRMKAEGVQKGVPDLLLAQPNGKYAGLWIEMKSPGCYPRPEQREWIDKLNNAGYLAVVCRGWEEAAETIEKYLEGRA